VLLAEDDTELRNLLRATLVRAGFEVTSVGDGVQLLREFGVRATELDLVITDVEMPVKNGLAAIEELRRSGYDTPVIVISGSGLANAVGAADSGACAYVEKPVPLDGLVALALSLTN